MRSASIILGFLSLAGLAVLGSSLSCADTSALTQEQIGGLSLSGGWVQGTEPRKCSDDATSSYGSADLYIIQTGDQIRIPGSEGVAGYKVKRARRHEYLPEIVLEMDFSGGGEGESVTGRALWFLHGSDPTATEYNATWKVDGLTTVLWIDSRQGDGEARPTKIKSPVPDAATYVRCAP